MAGANATDKKAEAYKAWYELNKEKIAKARKERYQNDPSYRQKALEHAEKARKNRPKAVVKPMPKGYEYNLTEAAAVLGVQPSTIRDWRWKGYLPRPKLWGGRFIFTGPQVAMLDGLREYLSMNGNKKGVHAPAFEDMKAFIFVNWK